jgi:hypothetical protein
MGLYLRSMRCAGRIEQPEGGPAEREETPPDARYCENGRRRKRDNRTWQDGMRLIVSMVLGIPSRISKTKYTVAMDAVQSQGFSNETVLLLL